MRNTLCRTLATLAVIRQPTLVRFHREGNRRQRPTNEQQRRAIHHRLASIIALTLALATTMAPVASADPPPLARAEAVIAHHASPSTPSCGDVCSGHGYGPGVGSAVVTTRGLSVGRHPAPSSGSFHWGDAGIGAASALALAVVGMGGLAATRRRGHPASAGQGANAQ
jgi:hypothetical protein